MKILVIEDQPTELKLAHQVLSAAGHNVDAIDACELAFAMIEKERPSIILLDLCLPGMDGLSLVRKLRENPDLRDILIVAVTSYAEQYTKSEVLAAGCDAYWAKPLNVCNLSEDLHQLRDDADNGASGHEAAA